jgi:uncharacterized membrane protein YbjE (DUF340 family)
MKTSLIILLFFIAGLAAGYLEIIPPGLVSEYNFSTWALYLLMLLVGISIGADKRAIKAVKSHGSRLMLVPVVTIAGTFVAMLPLALVLGNYSIKELLAVGAGFGYYSLSSIIISEIHSEALGVVALLANIIREIITLLFAPVMVIWLGKLAPVCSGGATSMDTTLPIITTSSGKEFAIVALFHGMVLTILVPLLVTFILSF